MSWNGMCESDEFNGPRCAVQCDRCKPKVPDMSPGVIADRMEARIASARKKNGTSEAAVYYYEGNDESPVVIAALRAAEAARLWTLIDMDRPTSVSVEQNHSTVRLVFFCEGNRDAADVYDKLIEACKLGDFRLHLQTRQVVGQDGANG